MGSQPSAAQLRVNRGDEILAKHHNGLVSLAEQVQLQRGQLKGRQDPDGFAPAVDVTTKTSVDSAFKMTLGEDSEGRPTISFSSGLVEGIAPKIGDREIDDLDENGDPPVLTVKEDAWAPLASGVGDRALVYLRYDLNQAFYVQSVEPVVLPKLPPAGNWTWYKLVGYLFRIDGSVSAKQMIFFNQHFNAVNVKASSGGFQAIPSAGG